MRIRRYFIVFLILLMAWQGYAYASALGAAARFSTAIAGVVEQQLVRRGFAANDPRFQATLEAVGVVANDSIANVAATGGMAIAGVAGLPVWATVAVGLGVGALVYGAYKLMQLPDGTMAVAANSMTDQEVVTAVANPPAPAPDYATGPATGIPQVPPATGRPTTYKFKTTICDPNSSYCQGLPVLPSDVPFIWSVAGVYAYAIYTVNDYLNLLAWLVSIDQVSGNCNPGALIGNCYIEWSSPPAYSTEYGYKHFTGTGVYKYTTKSNGVVGSMPIPYQWQIYNIQINSQYTLPPIHGTLDSMIPTLPSDFLNAPLSPDSLAKISDKAFQLAAANPSYQGYPYSLYDPVAAPDVNKWTQTLANPLPTGQDSLSPITGPVAMPNPYGATSAPPPVDLGPDPAIASPGLEATPTASQILSPVLNLMPDLKSFVVPSHTSVCPRPTATVWGHTLALSGHCDLLDSPAVRDSLYAVMALVWTLVALFIVLRA